MIDSKIPRIIKEKIVGNKVWQIISFSEDNIEKFDAVYFDKSDADKMVNELVSSKKIVKTFENKREAIKFLEKMELEKLKSKVEKAIKLFFKHDSFLIEKNINERSITHKLAEHLQLEFSEYHVDCEYNRMINRTRKEGKNDKEYIQKTLDLPIKDIKADDTKAKTVYPDIIIHERKTKNNLLVIEIKKAENKKGISFDIKKIKAYIEQLKYKNGLFVKISNDYNNTIKNSDWYDKNGNKIKK